MEQLSLYTWGKAGQPGGQAESYEFSPAGKELFLSISAGTIALFIFTLTQCAAGLPPPKTGHSVALI